MNKPTTPATTNLQVTLQRVGETKNCYIFAPHGNAVLVNNKIYLPKSNFPTAPMLLTMSLTPQEMNDGK